MAKIPKIHVLGNENYRRSFRKNTQQVFHILLHDNRPSNNYTVILQGGAFQWNVDPTAVQTAVGLTHGHKLLTLNVRPVQTLIKEGSPEVLDTTDQLTVTVTNDLAAIIDTEDGIPVQVVDTLV